MVGKLGTNNTDDNGEGTEKGEKINKILTKINKKKKTLV